MMELLWTPEAVTDREEVRILNVVHTARQWPPL